MAINKTTTAVRTGIDTDRQYGSVTPPLYLSSNFSFEDFAQPRQYDYTRSGNPTRDQLGKALAKLEGGYDGVITSSGMSAIYLVTHLLDKGDVIIAPHDCYGGSYRLFKTLNDKGQFDVRFVDQGNPSSLAEALKSNPKLIWIETPSNPLLRVVDIRQICSEVGDEVIKVVDNTFLSPILQQPLSLGADIVVHSTTKYINGHSDVVGGAVIAKRKEVHDDLAWWANCTGITGSPFDSFITTRGLRTLSVRMKQHEENASAVVGYLNKHPAVEQVFYPGLETHSTHRIAAQQQTGFGAMFSFTLNQDEICQKTFVKHLQLVTLAESLGGVESLICHPATMTHAALSPDALENAGIGSNLFRLSVGIEDAQDLINDLNTALSRSTLKALKAS
ncbi:cystathionine gamma-synthase [Porticoccaceae bacterium]|jgi:cystathionine gamma-synthase|nr:cystathionine gamma-synthase [Porticoccaceae bacterium]MDA8941444.1 cystathionine gamma-synthase [Porticoccaceae bacterium]MDB2400038.1 cystathionine gamma-synthase [Porticoccaceae bacterium]